MTRQWLIVFCLIFFRTIVHAQPNEVFVSEDPANGYLPLIKDGQPLPLQIDPQDDKGVLRAVESLQRDFEKAVAWFNSAYEQDPVKTCEIHSLVLSELNNETQQCELSRKH